MQVIALADEFGLFSLVASWYSDHGNPQANNCTSELDFGWDATDSQTAHWIKCKSNQVWQTTVNLQGWGGITNSQGIFTVLPC